MHLPYNPRLHPPRPTKPQQQKDNKAHSLHQINKIITFVAHYTRRRRSDTSAKTVSHFYAPNASLITQVLVISFLHL